MHFSESFLSVSDSVKLTEIYSSVEICQIGPCAVFQLNPHLGDFVFRF